MSFRRRLISFIWFVLFVTVVVQVLRIAFYFYTLIYFPYDNLQIPLDTDIKQGNAEKTSPGGQHNDTRFIPKIIHQMYKQNHSLPLHWAQARQSCESLYQPLGYEVKLWTDDELDRFMLLNYPDAYHGLFQTYRYQIQRIDAVRYFLLYHYGGIYLDLDIGCKKDITDLLYTINLQQATAVLPMTAPFGVSNDLVISPARHPFAKLMMDQLESHNYDLMLKSMTVLLSTGPAFVDRCIRLYAMQYGYHSGLAILPHECSLQQFLHHLQSLQLKSDLIYRQVKMYLTRVLRQQQQPMLQSVNNISSGMRMILPSFTRSPTVQAFVYEFNNTQPIGVALLQKSVFAAPIRSDIMHKCVVYQQGQMRGLVKAPYADINDRYSPVGKSRNEMGFSGRKILKQKGNGRARQGTRGSPSRFESGLAFPRKFIDFRIELPKKMQQFGLRSSLSSKYAQDQLRLVDGLESIMESSNFSDHNQLQRESLPLTAGNLQIENPLLDNSKFLYVLGDAAMVEKASGILPEDYKRIQFKTAKDLTAYDVLCHDYLLLSQEALQVLERKLHVY